MLKTIAQHLKDIPVTYGAPVILVINGEEVQTGPMAIIEDRFANTGKVAPCCLCGRDTFNDIFVSWALLWDYGKMIAGYRLCDYCNRQALIEDKDKNPGPFKPDEVGIMRMIAILRSKNGCTKSPDQWLEETTHPPLELVLPPCNEE